MHRGIAQIIAGLVCALALGLAGCGGSGSSGGDNDSPIDTDGDGVLDADDAFPSDATESVDTDGDGIGDNADTDDDADGVPDTEDDNPLDTDNDTLPNAVDDDDDDDGVPDSMDAFPLDSTESADTDGDGIGDNADTDTTMPDPNTEDTITTANGDGESFECIPNASANGAAIFDATFSGGLVADYNIRDNSTGCGGTNLFSTTSYSIALSFPDPGDPAGGDVGVLIDVDQADGLPAIGEDLPISVTFTLPASSDPGRGGSFAGQGCSMTITEVGQIPQGAQAIYTPAGTFVCDRLVLDATSALVIGAQPDIIFDTPAEFRAAVAVTSL